MNTSSLQYLLLGLVISGLGLTAVSAADAASRIGLWRGADAVFELFESEGRLSGKIVALSEPTTAEGKEKTDIYNPDRTKRKFPIIGLVFISGLARRVTASGKTARSMTRRVAEPIPVLWSCRSQIRLGSAALSVSQNSAELTFGRERSSGSITNETEESEENLNRRQQRKQRFGSKQYLVYYLNEGPNF